MTTIATDGVTIAADSRATRGNEIAPWSSTKICKRGIYVFAHSGAEDSMEPCIEWVLGGCASDKLPRAGPDNGWALLVIGRDGMRLYDNDTPYPIRVTPPFALGSGRAFAAGALYAGATPEQAVEIACKLDVWSAPPIEVIDIAEALRAPKLEAAE